jgi:branched-chain amino acid transport system substrate-binding protein
VKSLLLLAVAAAAIGLTPARAEVAIAMAGPMTGAYACGLLGQPVRVIIGDDACDAAQAVAVANKLAYDGAVFVAGHYCSHTSIAAARIYEQNGILMISPASTNPKLTDEGGENVFRVAGRDDLQGEIAGDYLADQWGGRAIAILHDGTTYGKGLADEAKKQLNARGTTEALYEAFTPGQADYSSLISRMQAADIEVFYIGGYSAEAALIVRQARTRGYQAQLVSGDGIVTEDFWLIAGSAGEGTLMTFFPDARGNPEAASAVDAFRARGYEPEGYTLHAYAAVQVWAQAVEKAGTLELDAVIEALRGGRFDTVLGALDFDQKGDVTTPSFVWYVWRNGRYVPRD